MSDPLDGLSLPSGDPDALYAQTARMARWLSGSQQCGDAQRAAVDLVTEREWNSSGAASARSGSDHVVSAFLRAADDMGTASSVVQRCATDWESARSKFALARQMADEAMLAAITAGTAHGAIHHDLARRAQDLARSAIEDFESATTRAAGALGRLARQIEGTPAFVVHHSRSHWYDVPIRWATQAVRAGEGGVRRVVQLGATVVGDPDAAAKLFFDAAQVGAGATVVAASAGGFGFGLALDATGAGAPIGLAANGASALGLVVGTGLVTSGSMAAMKDLSGVGSGGDGSGGSGPAGGTGGSLEGQTNYVVFRAPGQAVTDIDEIRDGTLLEVKTATWSMDDSDWVAKQVVGKFAKYMEARRLLPGYSDAAIGFEFIRPGALPGFRQSVEAAVDSLRSAYPDVTIYLRWAE
jgi:hypothetical protein